MFSTVSSNLNTTKSNISNHVTVGDVTGSIKLLVPGRATAATNIPQGAMTTCIDPNLLSGQCDIVQIMVGVNSFGTLELHGPSNQVWSKSIHWVRALRLSDDCHSYNVQLKLQASIDKKGAAFKLILQAVRPIPLGQELLLWFSEDILGIMQMVFLTPANIQGQKKYVCTRCSALYESPNPLKLHIILKCGRQSVSDLWNKLANLLMESPKQHSIAPRSSSEFIFKLNPEFSTLKQKNAMDLSTSNPSFNMNRPISHPSNLASNSFLNISQQDTTIFHRPCSEPPDTRSSAFKPFQKIEPYYNNQISELILHNIPNTQLYWPTSTLDQNFYNRNHLHNNDEAQIESLVSSLGKSKEGHICLYCGKCYSRKYGLKIHIRTHTGYKPLKCKFCMRPFGDPSNLNKHVRLHAEGDTPYKCDLCGKILVRRRDLERHLKSRHMGDIHPENNIIEEHTATDPDELTDEDNESTSDKQ